MTAKLIDGKAIAAQIRQSVQQAVPLTIKLRRAANLNLTPDLNDGVVLNIAPLWELVPWKEAQKYWEELLDGGLVDPGSPVPG